MKELNFKQIVVIVIIGIIIVATIGYYFYTKIREDTEGVYLEENYEGNGIYNDEQSNKESNSDSENTIIVHVTGCVKKPGIVELKEGERIVNAIDKAGGETEDSDLNKLNLAYELQDGEKLYIPSKSETKENIEYIDSSSGDNIITQGDGKISKEKNETININIATIEELQTLSGIGESTANKIIAYRQENGKFQTIEDIKNVPGIGDVKFETIKGNIRVK